MLNVLGEVVCRKSVVYVGILDLKLGNNLGRSHVYIIMHKFGSTLTDSAPSFHLVYYDELICISQALFVKHGIIRI